MRTQLQILIVEDDDNDFVLVSGLLSCGMPEVSLAFQLAQSASRALEEVSKRDYDLILLDHRLGNDDGLQLLRTLRRQGANAPVIFLAGQEDEPSALLAIKAGAADCLPKTKLTAPALRMAVRYALKLQKKDELLRQSRNAIRASEERFRALVENSSDVFTLLDADGAILYQSQAGERIFGRSAEQVIGRLAFDFVHPDDVAAAAAALKQSLAMPGQPITVEYRVGKDDGCYVEVESTGVNHLDQPSVQDIVLNQRNITERKRAIKTLELSEQRYRRLFERNLAGVFRAIPSGDLIECNDAFARIFGFASRDEAVGVHLRSLYGNPEERDSVLAELERKQVVLNREIRVRRKDGREAWVLVNSSLLRDAGGRSLAIEGTLLDITESRSLCWQLAQAQKMEAIGQLAGGVAHDFNNLLMVISGYADFLREAVDQDPRLKRYTHSILKAAGSASSLTRQLLAFSRKQVLSPKPLRLNSVIEDIGKMLPRILGEQIRVVFSLAGDAGNVLADPAQIEQVLMNLAVNARDAMRHGGQLTIETSKARFDESFARAHAPLQPGSYVMLSVTDNGEGIAPEVIPHIFEPFYTTKERGKGTGLGLSTVYGIVRQSGGNILVYSEPGNGTTFKVYLPELAEMEAGEHPIGGEKLDVRGSETILLVEDEASLREAAVEFLREHGYTVLQASNGADAVQVFRRHRHLVDIIVTDVIMPERTGPEFVSEIAIENPGIKVVYISGYTQTTAPLTELAGEGTPFLQKPFALSALAQAVRAVMDADHDNQMSECEQPGGNANLVSYRTESLGPSLPITALAG